MITLRQLIKEVDWGNNPQEPVEKSTLAQRSGDRNWEAPYNPTQQLFLSRLMFASEALQTKHHFPHDPGTGENQGIRTVVDKMEAWIRKFPARGQQYPMKTDKGDHVFVTQENGEEKTIIDKFYLADYDGAEFGIIFENDGKYTMFVSFLVSDDPESFNSRNSYLEHAKERMNTQEFKGLNDQIMNIENADVEQYDKIIANSFMTLVDMRMDTYSQMAQKREIEPTQGDQENPSQQPQPPQQKSSSDLMKTAISQAAKALAARKGLRTIKENGFKHLSQMLY